MALFTLICTFFYQVLMQHIQQASQDSSMIHQMSFQIANGKNCGRWKTSLDTFGKSRNPRKH